MNLDRPMNNKELEELEVLKLHCYLIITENIKASQKEIQDKAHKCRLNCKRNHLFNIYQELDYILTFSKHVYTKHLDAQLIDLMFGYYNPKIAYNKMWGDFRRMIKEFFYNHRKNYERTKEKTKISSI